jgi:hypothetical protein
MYQNFDDEKKEKASRNPFNRHILKGGQVDPGSKMYQRSVAGREKLDTMLQRLWSDGMDEADVFMAGVKALTSRDKGYVGAYLDSKNPGRIYQENEAMAITDQVMSDAGIGSHPGNRLTREKDEEGKAKRKEENISRGGFGPKQAPGAKAMSVRQQRKQGKRPSTGQPVEETDREGIADRETGPRSEWQNTLRDRMEGKATTADVLEEFQKQYQSRLSQSPQAQAKRDEKTKERQQKMRDQIAEQKGLEDQEAAAAGPEPETEEMRISADPVSIGNKFKELVQDNIKANIPVDKNSLEGMIQETIEIMEDDFDVDPEEARAAIFRRFNNKLIDGRKIEFDPSSAPEKPAPAGTKEPAEGAAPEEKEEAPTPAEGAAPEPRKVTSKGGFKAPKQPARRGGGGFGGSSPRDKAEIVKEVKKKISESTPEQLKEEFKQGTLFPSGLVTDTADTNPLEGGSSAPAPESSGPSDQEDPGQQGSLLDEEGKAKSSPKPFGSQRALEKRKEKIAKKGIDEELKSLRKGQEVQERMANSPAGRREAEIAERGQQVLEETQKSSQAKGKSPLDQVAKAVLSGIERDKAARESAGQFFNRVRDLIQKQAGRGASKSDVDQAAAKAINQQKGRTTRNKARKNTVDSAEYQEFAQSIRSMMR